MKKYDCSLRDVLDREMKTKNYNGRPLTDLVVLYMIIQIAIGMWLLYEKNIMHRDLKAANIFVNVRDPADNIPSLPCIGDFDVASKVVGTLFWRAPEVSQALKDGKRSVFTPKADVYSYAMICYEILTGCIPFDEVNATDYNVVLFDKRLKQPSDLHPKMEDLIKRCWHQDPEARPTFNEIVVELRGLHKELVTGSESVSKFLVSTFDNAKSCLDIAGADPESCLVELKELLQAVLVKYNQADFLVLAREIVAGMEQFQSQFGFQSYE